MPIRTRRIYLFLALMVLGAMLVNGFMRPAGARADSGRDPIFGARLSDVPAWLEMYDATEQLYSEYDMAGLAGHLIAYRLAEAGDCPSAGLFATGLANKCGIEQAQAAQYEWQNRLNAAILKTSRDTGVPPILMKNIFAWESQFWPTTAFVNTYEYGLGHLTEMGADSALRWNAPFYDSICAGALSADTCKKDYADQPAEVRAVLRGVVIQLVRADCSNCTYGLDLPLAERSTYVFAHTLLANASFVKYYVSETTGRTAAQAASYEDLWKFTLVSYNAGPGCFVNALSSTLRAGDRLNWENLSGQLEEGCQGSIPYVEFISKTDEYHPQNDPGRGSPSGPVEPRTQPGAKKETPPVNATASPTATLEATMPVDGPTATVTLEPSATGELPTATATEQVVETPTGTAETALPTSSPEATATPEASATPTGTAQSVEPTASPTGEITATGTLPVEMTGTPTATGSLPPEITGTPTATGLVPPEVTGTATPTGEVTATATLTPIPTETPTSFTETPSATATPTAIPEEVGKQLQAPHVEGELVLKIDAAHRQAVHGILQGLGVSLPKDGEEVQGLGSLVVQIQPEKLPQALAALQAVGVEIAEPNYLAQLSGLPNDPELYQQSSLWVVQVPETWAALNSSQEVIVAVIDTGVDLNHPDLADRIWRNPGEVPGNGLDDDGNGYADDIQGWNMVAGSAGVNDTQGHGTHLAGIIGAAVNNSTGVAGIAPNARILPVKALDNTGFGTYAQVAEAIVYATNMGARVINLGFGGTGSSELLQNAINYATDHGVLVVAAAGNAGTGVTYYPAGYSGVIAVGSIDNMLSWSTFSSFGDHLSLVAPGVSVYSTLPGGLYGAMSGTSMSAAEVSGIAALLAGQNQFSDPGALRSALLGGAFDLGTAGRDPYFGYGVVHALDSLGYAGPILPTPTPWIVPTSTPGGPGGVTRMSSTDMWAVNTQLFPPAPAFTHAGDAGSIDAAFNDVAASITGPLGASTTYRWTFDNLQDTALTAVVKAQLDVRMYVGGYVDDGYRIEIRQGSFWQIVARMRPGTGFAPVPTSMTTLTFDVSTLINTPLLANGAQVRIAGDGTGTNATAESVTVYVDEVRLRVWDAIPTPTPTALFMPTSTLPARAITATPRANEPHNNFVSASTDLCSACHRSHGAQAYDLRSAKGEENVCFACHTSGGSGTNVQPAFTSKTNTTTRFFKHNVFDTLNVHTATETGGGVFGGANRHIECEDCHKPHDSSRLAASASNAAPLTQQEMYNSAGVDPVWNAAGAPAGFNWTATAEREYQVCFKCHSSYTTLPGYQPDGWGYDAGAAEPGYITDGLGKLDNSSGAQVPDSRDLAKEFNSYQASFHPVAAQGRNQNIPAGSFVPGWSQESVVYCTSCHENSSAPTNGNGPHGSQLLHLLTGSSEYVTRPDPTTACTINPDGCPFVQDPGQLCFKCHQYGTYAAGSNPATTTDFRNTSRNLHSLHTMAACYTCHDTHGSEQQHLLNFDTSVVSILPGYNSQTAWNWNGSQGTCYIACHGNTHGAVTRFQYTR